MRRRGGRGSSLADGIAEYQRISARVNRSMASGAQVKRTAGLALSGGAVYYPGMITKPGYKTTEWWTTLAVAVAQVLNLLGVWDFVSNWHSGIILTIVTAAYTASRGIAKHGR